jgi:nucleoside phosphorylase
VTGERLTAPGLLAHVFLVADPHAAPDGWNRLRTLWRDSIAVLRLSAPVPALGVPSGIPAARAAPEGPPKLLAAAESRRSSVWQAMAWADHHVLCLTAMMAPPRGRDCARAWAHLEDDWAGVTASLAPADVLGETRIFVALLASSPGSGPSPEPAAGARLAGLVRDLAPASSGGGWWQHWDTVRLDGPGSEQPGARAQVWEIGPEEPDGRSRRRFAVIGPEAAERPVDQLLWTTGDGAPVPLTRHLLHAARLRHQVRLFDGGGPSRRVREQATRPAGDRAGPGRPDVASTAIGELRGELGAMRDAVGIIADNMRNTLALPAGDASVGPLSGDRELAGWFRGRLEDEVAQLDAAAQRAAAGRREAAPRMPDRDREAARLALVREPAHVAKPHPRSVVIFTALEAEYQAIRSCLTGPVTEREVQTTLYEVGTLPGRDGLWSVALAQAGPGGLAAGVQLERAVRAFDPQIALFLGVAGGRKEAARGDVVVGDVIYDYEGGKDTRDGLQLRIRTWRPAARLLQRAQRVAEQGQWLQRIGPGAAARPPRAFIKPIVAGQKVVTHPRSDVGRLVSQVADDALAVEMEAHGFLAGAYLNPGVEALVVRGISDLLTGKSPGSDAVWQPVASRHAAAFAVELLATLGTAAGSA